MVTRDEIKQIFYEEVRRIWGPGILKYSKFNFIFDKDRKTFMGIGGFKRRKYAVGSALFSSEREYNVYFSQRMLSVEPNYARKIIIHEVIHIGYPQHSQAFFDLTKRWGGCMTAESSERDLPYRVEIKNRGRYKEVRAFADWKTAEMFGVELQKKTGRRTRIKF